MENTEANTWRLESFEVKFKQGFSFQKDPKDQVDRYEGKVVFKNKEQEEFRLNVDQITSQQFLDIISGKMIETTKQLVDKIQVSIK